MATTKKPSSTSKKLVVKVKKLTDNAMIPVSKTEGAAGYDIASIEVVRIRNLNAELGATVIHTGLAFEIPEGYHMKVFLRSGIAYSTKLRLANHVAIIDSDYRGELMLLVENPSRQPIDVPAGTRIAQCIIERNIPVSFEEAEELGETVRGTGGLGSTGRD